MARVTIATWNVNSVRLRLDTVLAFLRRRAPEVLCLQEIKAEDRQFPRAAFAELGWPHIAVAGFKGYNGVATVSRIPFRDHGVRHWCGLEDGRHVWTALPGGLELHNIYVPAGGDEPDPDRNPKFAHKLRFLADMALWFEARKRPRAKRVLLGDLNVAPHENDVWSHKQLLNVVSHTPVEVAALARLQRAHDWIDAVRRFIPESERLYSWWSYRARDWAASDRGRRLDHIWVTPALGRRLRHAEVLREARGWTLPSDHVPVMASLDLAL